MGSPILSCLAIASAVVGKQPLPHLAAAKQLLEAPCVLFPGKSTGRAMGLLTSALVQRRGLHGQTRRLGSGSENGVGPTPLSALPATQYHALLPQPESVPRWQGLNLLLHLFATSGGELWHCYSACCKTLQPMLDMPYSLYCLHWRFRIEP